VELRVAALHVGKPAVLRHQIHRLIRGVTLDAQDGFDFIVVKRSGEAGGTLMSR